MSPDADPRPTPLARFLEGLLSDGRAVLRETPEAGAKPDARSLVLLERAHARLALDVAGPPLAFVPEVAWRAADVVHRATWCVLLREPDAKLPDRLPAPRAPADHLSADVCLRFLPRLLQRARAMAPAGTIVQGLATILARYPVSGVLADLPERAGDLAIPAHPGLELLYAERLAQAPKRAWAPPPGPARERLELVLAERGETSSALLASNPVEGQRSGGGGE